MNEREPMKDDMGERIATLEAKVNGGPGNSTICKMHKEALDEFKVDLKSLRKNIEDIKGQLRYWAGGLALLFVLSSVLSPFLKDIASAILHKP